MAETILRQTASDEEAQMCTAIDESFAEMQRIRAGMKQIQEGIGKSEERTNQLSVETKAVLARIEATIHAKATL